MRVKRGFWQEETNIVNALVHIYKKHGEESLNYTWMRSNGYNALLCGIQRTKKSISYYLELASLPITFVDKNYYKDISRLNEAIHEIVEQYGYFPSRTLAKEANTFGILNALAKHHETTLTKHLTVLGIEYDTKHSKLEEYVKRILNHLIEDACYIDNARKLLLEYGLDTKNPSTGRYLEIDRYYYVQKVAIEIQGQQHLKESAYWDSDRCNSSKSLDIVKQDILNQQGVKLITIPYNKIGVSTIYKQLQEAGIVKLCEKAKVSELLRDNTLPSPYRKIRERFND